MNLVDAFLKSGESFSAWEAEMNTSGKTLTLNGSRDSLTGSEFNFQRQKFSKLPPNLNLESPQRVRGF